MEANGIKVTEVFLSQVLNSVDVCECVCVKYGIYKYL